LGTPAQSEIPAGYVRGDSRNTREVMREAMMRISDIPRRALRRALLWLGSELLRMQAEIAKSSLPEFSNRPKNLTIELPRRLINPEFMTWGDDVWIGPGAFITAVRRYPSPSLAHPDRHYDSRTFSPSIRIGNRVTSSGSLIIGAAQRVTVGDDVMFASNVTLLDNFHGFDQPHDPYKYQPLTRISAVEVKSGCWIGQNVVIMPGVEIGEMCIVGANSVVTESLPARVIAAGAPARIIKRWDEDSQCWVKCAGARDRATASAVAPAGLGS
jgi:lipopolysaccharide O-acetyltransferase